MAKKELKVDVRLSKKEMEKLETLCTLNDRGRCEMIRELIRSEYERVRP